jgi:uncharacterized membrane protein
MEVAPSTDDETHGCYTSCSYVLRGRGASDSLVDMSHFSYRLRTSVAINWTYVILALLVLVVACMAWNL